MMTKSDKIKPAKKTVQQKLLHIGKVCIFLVTLGFAFPNILLD